MTRRLLRVFCLAAATVLFCGCGLMIRIVAPKAERETPAPSLQPAQTAAPALTPKPVPEPTPEQALSTAAVMEKDTPYTFHETTFTITAKESEDYPWDITRLLAEEDNGWASAVEYDGAFASAYYCETENGPCILISTNLEAEGMTYALDAASLAEADSKDGCVRSIEGGMVSIERYVDMLGTYLATRSYTIDSGFTLQPTGDGLFHTIENEYFLITTKKLPVQLQENGQYRDETLDVGTELSVTATDGASIVYFTTRDGRTGKLVISRKDEWPIFIEGTSAEEWFAELPYAG